MGTTIVKSLIKGIIYAAIGVCVWFGIHAYGVSPTAAASFPTVPSEKWQAVFLEAGQVYFGKLADHDGGYVALSNVYYLKEAADLQQSNLNLVKLGGELHGPEDVIYIRKESITFWENMKDTSRVVKSIEGARQ